jgi:four helix bundle protein
MQIGDCRLQINRAIFDCRFLNIADCRSLIPDDLLYLRGRYGLCRSPVMTPDELKRRTYNFGVAVVNFCKTLPDTVESRRIRGQLTDSGTSVPANYRGACRARSTAEFIAKIGVCCEEADESNMWLTLCADTGLASRSVTGPLADEAEQLTRIFTASQLTAKQRRRGTDR